MASCVAGRLLQRRREQKTTALNKKSCSAASVYVQSCSWYTLEVNPAKILGLLSCLQGQGWTVAVLKVDESGSSTSSASAVVSAGVAAARNAFQLAASSPTLFGMRLGIWRWQCPAPIPATLWPLIRLGWVLPALRHAAGATSLRASLPKSFSLA